MMRFRALTLMVAWSWWILSVAFATAQELKNDSKPPVKNESKGGAKPPDPETADLAITATVKARELRFEKVPDPKVEFSGAPKRRTGSKTERKNLPREIKPKTTYREMEIRLTISSVFDDEDVERILSDALGERVGTRAGQKAAQNQASPTARPKAPVGRGERK